MKVLNYLVAVNSLVISVSARLGISNLFRGQKGASLQHPKLRLAPRATTRSADDEENDQSSEFDEFILILDNDIEELPSAVQVSIILAGGEIKYEYKNVFKGAAVSGILLEKLIPILDNESIIYATPNNEISSDAATTQRFPSWGLDRLDQSNYPLDRQYKYEYDGSGVTIFVLDTGIKFSHQEFSGRVSCGFNAFEGFEDCDDLNGHGTHVAGIAAGNRFGVAKHVNIEAVKVLNKHGFGRIADSIAGIDYVIGQKRLYPDTPMIINMSYSGLGVDSENEAVNAAANAGIIVVAAAGNGGYDSCRMSPGSAEKALTVGATDNGALSMFDDRLASFSNTGPCIDIFAPGSNIASASIASDRSVELRDGTSQATAFVAGAAALYLQRDSLLTPEQLLEELKKDAIVDAISSLDASNGAPNLLLNTQGLLND